MIQCTDVSGRASSSLNGIGSDTAADQIVQVSRKSAAVCFEAGHEAQAGKGRNLLNGGLTDRGDSDMYNMERGDR